MDEASGVYKFASVGELSETVTQLLGLGLHYRTTVGGAATPQPQTGLEQIEQLILQQARDYLAEVREGFALSVRTTQVTKRSELRFLLDQVLVNWESDPGSDYGDEWGRVWDELGFADGPVPESVTSSPSSTLSSSTLSSSPNASSVGNQSAPPERIRQQLLAFGMAAVALGHLPRLPADHITFPHSYSKPATYADIPTPDTPAELLSRIDELEQMTRRLMGGDLQQLLNRRYGALRRTYGFFEASAHLARKGTERFGFGPKRGGISLL